MAVKLVTDSTSYIDQATRDELGILVVNLSVHFPEVSYDETDIEYDEFYKKIERDNIIPTSSQPTIDRSVKSSGRLLSAAMRFKHIYFRPDERHL